ncbi:MAG: preprotein translocase subunit YajC [Ignavibacteriae bacterium]|nr:preprotein translocase subunit YajC [Ignavibacteriota bacterium]MCB9215485.1 preprotein translocase subunit YajC [Ignavibacteria bacterium]
MDFYSIFLFAPPPGGEGGASSMLPTLLMFGAIGLIFYFMIIRPQSKRMKEHRALIAAVKRGDKVTMNGGLHGTIHEVKETTVLVEIARNTVVEYEKGSIQGVAKSED